MSVLDGVLRSEGGAVRLDYSSSSSFLLQGGEVISASGDATLTVKKGSAALSGGYIENTFGTAIVNHSTLRLGRAALIKGASYDVMAYEPVNMSYLGESFSSVLDIKYMSEFTEGSLTPILYECNAAMSESITLTDVNGKSLELSYFENYSGYTEECFLAVYLPYEITYMCFGQVLSSVGYLEGECVSEPDAPDVSGYILDGWYTDAGFSNRYSFGGACTGARTLYAKYTLENFSYSISDLAFEYDGTEHLLDFSSLSHTLAGDFRFEWKNESGVTIANTRSIAFKNVSDSGKYKCRITFTYGSDEIFAETLYINVAITKREVAIPSIEPQSYTGRYLYPDISSNSIYTAQDVCFVNAGSYPVTLTLNDSENNIWSSGETHETQVSFEITVAVNAWIEEIRANNVYYGAEFDISCVSKFGDITYLYSSHIGGEYTATSPSAVGIYYVKAFVPASENWGELTSAAVAFSILEDSVISLSVNTYPTRVSYTAFELFDGNGLTLIVVYKSGKSELLTAGDISLFYQSSDSLRTSHTGIIAEYKGLRITVPVSVKKAVYDMNIGFEDETVIYDGLYHTLSLGGTLPTGQDGISVAYKLSGGGSDVGKHEVVLTFFTSSTEYEIPTSMTAYLTIQPRVVELISDNNRFVYDGTEKLPSAYYTDIYGAKIALDVTGSAVNAGDGYIATAYCKDKNYVLDSSEIPYSITKADYDLSGAVWSGGDFVYDGEQKRVLLSGLPQGVQVVGYVNNTATDSGVYKVSVSLSYDSANYNEPIIAEYTWEIRKADYDMSAVDFLGGERVYNGGLHYPTLVGNLPSGLDGSVPSYSFSTGLRDVTDGIVYITVEFSVSSKNYNTPSSITVALSVVPQGIDVEWSELELIYNGGVRVPVAYSPLCEVAVEAVGIDAGTYTATAHSLDKNYCILNATVEYRITKAENYWVSEPFVRDIYHGQEPSRGGEAFFGDISFLYFTDEELTEEATLPLAVGSYYALAIVGESDNFIELRGAAMPFRVMAVFPVSVSVTLTRDEFYAFDSLSDKDFVCTVTNNDGTSYILPSTEVSVIYENGDRLYAKDESIAFSTLGFTVELPITVNKLDYDMSSVIWENTVYTYDGEPKYPALAGLPLGITVTEYIGVGAVDSGEYVLGAILEYDEENYNAPTLPAAHLIIKKRGISPTLSGNAVYDGTAKTPIAESPLYITVYDGTITEAGQYTVSFLLLSDRNHYLLYDTAVFTVAPRALTVHIDGQSLYWFESAGNFTYTVTEGAIVQGDDLMLRFYTEGDSIFAASDNPNYSLTVLSGEIVRMNRPSPRFIEAFFIILLLLILLIFIVVILVFKREAILESVAAYRSRKNSARPVADIPPTIDFELGKDGYFSVDVDRAEVLITDNIAKTLIRKSEQVVVTEGRKKCIINVDTLSESFEPGARIDINVLKERGLVPKDASVLRVLGRGSIDKPLVVYANHFSLSAVKMIALTGGEVNKTVSVTKKNKNS